MFFYLRNPKTVLRKILTGLILFFLGAVTAYLTSLILPWFVDAFWGSHPFTPIFIMTIIFLVAFKPIERAVKWFLEKYFFHKKSYAQWTLTQLAEELKTNLDLQELSNLIVNTLGEILHLKTVAILASDPLRGSFEVTSAFGWPLASPRKVCLNEESPLVKMIHRTGPHVLVREPLLKTLTWQGANDLARDFDQLRAGWVIPLFVGDRLVGLLALGAYSPDTIFDKGDFQFFREFAGSVAVCLLNAQVVRGLKTENFELQDSQAEWFQKTKMSAIERLAAGIAHEVHNPLAIISGKAQVLLMQKNRTPLEPHIEDALNVIVKQTRRAADITKKLLVYSQASKAPRERVSLEKVLDDTVAVAGYQAMHDKIEITRAVDPDLPLFLGNVQELREVFLNLFLNAAEAIGSEGKIHIELRRSPEDEVIEVRFSDSGKGIAPDDLEKVFNPFFTTRHDAVGLGLFVTQQIVHRYGGAIRAESRPGEGSLFVVQLPLSKASSREADEESRQNDSVLIRNEG
ncbi:MAG: Sensor protein ZraS [Candidatus Omnitrophica bacterium ADurb.Bin277]|nr:MAG: Sensor protein ZraS [Candidatus Omnitrophica bacterium ADurb.Bin277]